MPDPINQPVNSPQPFPEMPDIPVMPQDTTQTTPIQPVTIPTEEVQQGQPIDDIPPIISGGDKPKKKGVKIVATILGVFLLIGAVGAGVVLVNQNQDIREKAGPFIPSSDEVSPCTVGQKQEGSCTNSVDGNDCPGKRFSYCIGNRWGEWGICQDIADDCPPKPKAQGCAAESQNCVDSLPNRGCCDSLSCVNGKCQSTTTTNKTAVTTNETAACSEVKCSANGCTIGNHDPSNCWVMHYWCPNMTRATAAGGCSEQVIGMKVKSANFSKSCGVEQIDIYCPSCGIGSTLATGGVFVSNLDNPACGTTPPTPPGETARCETVKAYDSGWNLLSSSDLSALSAGSVVRFTISGSPADKIDKARFTITPTGEDITQSGEVTNKKTGTDEYYYEYTIPSGVTTFNVTAQVHHLTLGWF